MNDPISDLLNGLGTSINGIGTGTNSLAEPGITSLFGFNIPGIPLISSRDFFLAQMESWFTSIPMTSQWMIVIDRYPAALSTSIIQGLERVAGDKQGFDIDMAKSILTSYPLQRVVGCIFAHAVTIPTEQYSINSVSVANNRGYLPGIIADGRQTDALSLVIDFKDTNTSFVDFIIRPWTILAAHFGLCARPGDTDTSKDIRNMKCNITVMQFTRTIQNISMVPRKVWHFYNCVPTTVGEESLTYDVDTLPICNTRWTYTNYTIDNNMYIPVGSIINSIANGNIPTISPLQTNGIPNINPLDLL